MKKILKNKKGFTLIEVVTVAAIATSLILLSVVYVKGVQSRKRDLKRLADAQDIVYALEQYYNYYGRYPEHLTNASESPNPLFPLCTDNGWDDSDCQMFVPALIGSDIRNDNPQNVVFMEEMPMDPNDDGKNAACYQSYLYTSLGGMEYYQGYRLVVMLENANPSYPKCENYLDGSGHAPCTGTNGDWIDKDLYPICFEENYP